MAKFHIDFNKHSLPVQKAAHAIGLDHKRPYMRHGKAFYRPYRNYFITHDNAPDFKVWQGLRENGYAKRHPTGERGEWRYHLTRAGMDWLGETLGITINDERVK